MIKSIVVCVLAFQSATAKKGDIVSVTFGSLKQQVESVGFKNEWKILYEQPKHLIIENVDAVQKKMNAGENEFAGAQLAIQKRVHKIQTDCIQKNTCDYSATTLPINKDEAEVVQILRNKKNEQNKNKQ